MIKRLLLGGSLVGALACCVARGTRIRTPAGLRPVEDLREGDEVFCLDPQTAQLVAGRLSAIRTARRECIELGYGQGALLATSDHPLYCPQTRQWAPAGDWGLGTRTWLLRAEGEEVAPVEVDRRSTFAGVHEVFDLTVDHPLHNFVANGVLVHNKSAPWTCLNETHNLRAETTCGPVANLVVESRDDCRLVVTGADFGGLPTQGRLDNPDVRRGFTLEGDTDAGFPRVCKATPADGGFAILCAPRCPDVECDGGRNTRCTVVTGADGGSQTTCVTTCPVDNCDVSCGGKLVSQ